MVSKIMVLHGASLLAWRARSQLFSPRTALPTTRQCTCSQVPGAALWCHSTARPRHQPLCRSICKATISNGEDPFDLKVLPADQSLAKGGKLRLDTFLAASLSAEGRVGAAAASRARVQGAIKAGGVVVNGRPATKASAQLKVGDVVVVTLPPLPQLQALPEAIPLDVVYEDEHVMVINKPGGMAVHISAGHTRGTLVNALLHHCGLPGIQLDSSQQPSSTAGVAYGAAGASGALLSLMGGPAATDSDWQTALCASGLAQRLVQGVGVASAGAEAEDGLLDEDEGEEEAQPQETGRPGLGSSSGSSSSSSSRPPATGSGIVSVRAEPGLAAGVLRPGIVHRLDLGTSGLLVVAKREGAQRHLSAQFKARTVGRVYESLSVGCPDSSSGRVLTNIDRDLSDRKRMASYPYGGGRGRTAASNYTVLEQLAGGASALVQWRLETGRTHQIRVHAKHIGHPLLGDVTYGGGGQAALSMMARSRPSTMQGPLKGVLALMPRPALHARSLAFDHPVSGERLSFEVPVPRDFQAALEALRVLS